MNGVKTVKVQSIEILTLSFVLFGSRNRMNGLLLVFRFVAIAANSNGNSIAIPFFPILKE